MMATLTALAAHRLPGARVTPFDDVPLPDPAWGALTRTAAGHGVAGLLADAVHERRFVCTPAQRQAAATDHVRALSGCLALESTLLDAVDELAGRGIDVLVVNGSVGAHLDYPDPALRLFGDVDLLVPPSDLAGARAALAAAGFRPAALGQPGRLVDASGRQVELHTHALAGRWARHVPASELWQRPAALELGGRRLSVLAPEQRLVAACLKASTSGRRLITVRDVAQQVLGGVDPDDALELARRWRVVPGVAAAIDDAWDRFGLADVVALSVWAARNRTSRRQPGAIPRRKDLGRRWLVRR
jgi:hypothetical protein